MEDKEVVIESLASFVCDEDDSNDRTFGFKYSSENASVSILILFKAQIEM